MLYSQPLLPPLHAKTTMHIRSASNTNEVNWDDPLNKGLVAWYPFKQKGGNVLRDVAGNYDGTLQSSMTSDDWVISPVTRSMGLEFDGVDDNVEPFPNRAVVSGFPLTISAWVKPDSDAGSIVNLSTSGTGTQQNSTYLYVTADNKPQFNVQDNNVLLSAVGTTAMTAGQWHFMACTLFQDGAVKRGRVFLDGIFQASDTTTASIDTRVRTTIGASRRQNGAITAQLRAALSDIRIYNRALSLGEIHDLYQASRTGYQDQFKRRYFPVSLQTEEPPTETATSGLIRLKSPKQTQPSYKAGYAKSASESANPELWDGLEAAFVPALGPTGGTIRDISKRLNLGRVTGDAVLESMDPSASWEAKFGSWGVNFDSSSSDYASIPGGAGIGYNADTDFAIVTGFECTAPESASFVYSEGRDDNTRPVVAIRIDDDGTSAFGTREIASGASFNLVSGTETVTDGKSHGVVGDYSRTTFEARHWQDGKYSGSATHDNLNRSLFNRSTIGALGRITTANFLDGRVTVVLRYSRRLSQEEATLLSLDPLAPFRQRRYFPVSLQTEEPSFNHWYAIPGRINRIVGSGVHV